MTELTTQNVRVHGIGGIENLRMDTLPLEQVGPDEVRISVDAIGLNRAEIMFREGQYLEDPIVPAQLGYEASGIVQSVGENVQSFSDGDKVSTIPGFSMNSHGVFGTIATVPASVVAKYPKNLTAIQATSIWMQYITAYGALVWLGKANLGNTILITAASSSVGVAAIQIAKLLNCKTIATTRTRAKAEKLFEQGADHVIVTDEEDIVSKVEEYTNGKMADIIFDPIGGPQLLSLADAAAEGALIVEYGALSTEPTPYPLFAALSKQLTVRGYTLFELTKDPNLLAGAISFVSEGLLQGKLEPIIDRVFKFEEYREAYEYLAKNTHIGKVVVSVER